jgi:O-antigen/teichoic acid export membrane protein
VAGVSFSITLGYFLFSRLAVELLFGEEYFQIIPSLGTFAIFISLYSLCSLLINFYLSIAKTKAIIFPALAAVLQIVLIACYHNSIKQIININIMVMSILFLGLLVYYFSLKKTKVRLPAINILNPPR